MEKENATRSETVKATSLGDLKAQARLHRLQAKRLLKKAESLQLKIEDRKGFEKKKKALYRMVMEDKRPGYFEEVMDTCNRILAESKNKKKTKIIVESISEPNVFTTQPVKSITEPSAIVTQITERRSKPWPKTTNLLKKFLGIR